MRWEEEAQAAAARAGAEIVERAGVDDYQGWGAFLLRRGGSWGVLSWSYGSCSGCDNYEDLGTQELRDAFDGLITWYLDEAAGRLAFDGARGW